MIGGRNSGRAIILPTDADELTRWRRRHPAYTYWCGTQLGGCGNELSDHLYRDKVCHFAHRPHTSCHRTATGVRGKPHARGEEFLGEVLRDATVPGDCAHPGRQVGIADDRLARHAPSGAAGRR
ncbi:hypothetical protein PYK79_35330 [Streptomyces sp. ID05-04B]|uniref:hypothetical protein n=1 Tax=unclassified Streptomyces TaxID=2593676 RepID=UPI0020B127BD|nr:MULTISPECIES: hypothetical protein [unclassified Streptomyces]MDX5567514.1 hypothetical protein [Streptomyces sp. ID05-04B]